ncbi:MAG TPA: class I SAM-dependent methyltransferase [Acidimicrobiales bacterium]|jgi:SAM-dependent methyltransferase
MRASPDTQYATDANLRARQRLWETSPQEPAFSLYPWVLALADLRGGERILDVGCGNGGYLALVEATGLDLSIGMLAAARERTSGPLVCGDVQRLPFPTGWFDLVLAPHMLYHVPDRVAAARELRRVLRTGGRCIAVTNSGRIHWEMVGLVEDVVGHGWRMQRPSNVAFSLENGADQLRTAFEQVERVDAPPVVFSVTDVDAFAAYIASIGDHYEDEVSAWRTWHEVVEECRHRAAGIIDEQGAFRISTAVGAFVCS